MFKFARVPFNQQKTFADSVSGYAVKREKVIHNNGMTDSEIIKSVNIPKAYDINPWDDDTAYWEFDTQIINTDNRGLVVTNVNIRNNSRSLKDYLGLGEEHTTENIFEEISVHGIKMHFEDIGGGRAHTKEFKFNVKDNEREAIISAIGKKEAYKNTNEKKSERSYADKGEDELYAVSKFTFVQKPVVQRAIRFSAFNYFRGHAKAGSQPLGEDLIEVRCDIHISFCTESANFDQVEAFYGLKVYPEVVLSYRSILDSDVGDQKMWDKLAEENQIVWLDDIGDLSMNIVEFEAAVKLIEVPNNKHMPMGNKNYAGFFTDANSPTPSNRYSEVYFDGPNTKNLTSPGWAYIFDYLQPNLEKESKYFCVGADSEFKVYGIDPYQTTQKDRTNHFAWPQRTIAHALWHQESRILKKRNRQGAFDNLHVHGEMMKSMFGDDAIHAPICGRACVHMHWRWGDGAGFIDVPPLVDTNILEFDLLTGPVLKGPSLTSPDLHTLAYGDRTNKFNGWNKNKAGNWVAHDIQSESLGLPLIPPNQSLKVAITDPSKGYNEVVEMDINKENSIDLDTTKKAVWYMVKIYKPNKGRKQVIFSHGIGYALEYHKKKALIYPLVANMVGLGLSGEFGQSALQAGGLPAMLFNWPNDVLTDEVRLAKRSEFAELVNAVAEIVNIAPAQEFNVVGFDDGAWPDLTIDQIHRLFLYFYDYIRYFYANDFVGRHQSPNGTHTKAWNGEGVLIDRTKNLLSL